MHAIVMEKRFSPGAPYMPAACYPAISTSYRYALLAALAEGATRLTHFSTSANPWSNFNGARTLGASLTSNEDAADEVVGPGSLLNAPN